MTDTDRDEGYGKRVYREMPREDAPAVLDKNNGYAIDGDLYVVYNGRLWRRTGQTHNPRVIALADAVSWEGELLTVHVERPMVLLQHHIGGIEHEIHGSERTEWCFVTYEEVDTL